MDDKRIAIGYIVLNKERRPLHTKGGTAKLYTRLNTAHGVCTTKRLPKDSVRRVYIDEDGSSAPADAYEEGVKL